MKSGSWYVLTRQGLTRYLKLIEGTGTSQKDAYAIYEAYQDIPLLCLSVTPGRDKVYFAAAMPFPSSLAFFMRPVPPRPTHRLLDMRIPIIPPGSVVFRSDQPFSLSPLGWVTFTGFVREGPPSDPSFIALVWSDPNKVANQTVINAEPYHQCLLAGEINFPRFVQPGAPLGPPTYDDARTVTKVPLRFSSLGEAVSLEKGSVTSQEVPGIPLLVDEIAEAVSRLPDMASETRAMVRRSSVISILPAECSSERARQRAVGSRLSLEPEGSQDLGIDISSVISLDDRRRALLSVKYR